MAGFREYARVIHFTLANNIRLSGLCGGVSRDMLQLEQSQLDRKSVV